jgi:hypothetical protein
LLAGKIGRELEGAERSEAQTLAELVGHLPLALELAAAQISDEESQISWAELRRELEKEIADLQILEPHWLRHESDETQRKQHSLLASFNLSLKRLTVSQRQAFIWLGVLPEDANIISPVAALLWK